MKTDDLIIKKRDNKELTKEEIDYLVQGYTKGDIPDYQISAFLMAAFLNGMTQVETANLTQSMVNSGETLDLSSISGIKVDKHSTGGVGDKTTLTLGPLVASAGLNVAKMSGRGLGHTGGTIDKLEAFQGLKIDLTMDDFVDRVNKHNIAIVGQTKDLAPADGKLYALRDVTGTVDSIPLIASSIMSKKLAAGTDAIVLDVKVGKGAFMQTLDDAIALGHEMVNIGDNLGRKTIAVISDMDQPLGKNVGNALEVIEAIDTLKGQGPKDFEDLCLHLGANLLLLGEKVETLQQGRNLLQQKITNGEALEKFEELIKVQNGDYRAIHDNSKLPTPKHSKTLKASTQGYISSLDARKVGLACVNLGAGRKTKEDEIDLSVGVELLKKTGDKVKKDEPIAKIWYNEEQKLNDALPVLDISYEISEQPTEDKHLIYGMITIESNPGELDPIN
ncbi:pyrimidine-nucleoside phosphorylase [Natranaerobius trueperi]|uniref:Pyrimidine-nucleoside phosphorylase n=1 Tax=Natranaerobius trueperi TaxID=759412 RepID=A0A226BYA7_9FIRM|nr:pyrimidine-nucleoside phosphorylase [Natranaerobius trueperi]OWZ83986.1 pyrimidine-nucleoside phosphorylase [Natranaerobius trueperi]